MKNVKMTQDFLFFLIKLQVMFEYLKDLKQFVVFLLLDLELKVKLKKLLNTFNSYITDIGLRCKVLFFNYGLQQSLQTLNELVSNHKLNLKQNPNNKRFHFNLNKSLKNTER